MTNSFASDIENCLRVLKSGGTILFPTDTVWGIGCDATNELAVEKVLQIKQRSQAQGLIILLANETELAKYVTVPRQDLIQIFDQQPKPTTIIYEGGKNVAANILPTENTLAIRIVKDEFCKQLINLFGKPIVSTSANIHGQPTPMHFGEIEKVVIDQIDYVVQHRQQERSISQPSAILKIKPDGSVETIRK
jgi:L-threonylcarbamoyladenylate synthase